MNTKYKRRRAITNAQRRALRSWFFDNSNMFPKRPKTHADGSAWWEQTYGYYLNSSTVSEILSYKYDPLDKPEVAAVDVSYHLLNDRKRQRPAKWEVLEEELIQWVFWYESVVGAGNVTGSMLRKRGTELWSQLPCYEGMSPPKWSEGWLARFRARCNQRRAKMLSVGPDGSLSPSLEGWKSWNQLP